jgi:hypothetical protein
MLRRAVKLRNHDGPEIAVPGENDGGSLAGNESSDASSTRSDSSDCNRRRGRSRMRGNTAVASPAPAAIATKPQIMRFVTFM